MSETKLKYLFNPTQKDARQLKAEFVVRTAIFNQIFTDIQEDAMQKPPQHYMILGQRGMGKTTLLLRIKYAVQDDENLQQWLLPVVFNEEQYAMSDLASFFEHIAQIIAEDHPSSYESLLEEMRKYEFENDYDQKAFEILVEYLKKNEQKIIVFHDNFGQFLEKIGKVATHRLRNILMNSTHIRLVGASATLLEHTFNYKEPFFDFFYQIRLKGMTSDETILLFEKLAENEGKADLFKEILQTERPRIDVMRKLSGGVIRTMVMLFDVFIDNEKQDSFKDLEAILDRVTPLYKHRMDDLKPQQQQIVDAVARAWDAVTVSEIAELSRAERQGLKTNQISAQLKQLVENGIIEIEPRTTGRTNLYRLQERFFNIWYLMRYSTRQDKQRVIWFVKFLEGWCNTNDLKQLFERFDNNLERGTYELNTVFDRALAYSMVDNDEVNKQKIDLIMKAISFLELRNYDKKSLDYLKKEASTLLINQAFRSVENILNDTLKELSLFNLRVIRILLEEASNKAKTVHSSTFFYELSFITTTIGWLLSDKVEISLKSFAILYDRENSNEYWTELLTTYFFSLIRLKQYHTANKLFQDYPELKDRLKPIYYLTMEYLKDEYPNEYLKAGEEYRETIEELKERVKWFEQNLS
ncbi:helix-turn-helix domain-containing protein [Arcicella sp. LKC2W]|uniref:helix-turn-helix domain-containing protein n=1 Tax=Arcicella sp. LKC2W TaxID=2984198 RepID=UPI002B1F7C11|nr:helix-turn-helix domain-containing protein [Arcicella sp. LKC2W]MEA5458903.1 helix-turn-helix domain-containing protein [Arcicella sp. LKC2W]